jgi:hypothetical protein
VAESVRDDNGDVLAEVASRGVASWWRRRHGKLVDALDAEPYRSPASKTTLQIDRIPPLAPGFQSRTDISGELVAWKGSTPFRNAAPYIFRAQTSTAGI